MMALNLLPVKPLDGADAWRLFRVGDLLPSPRNVMLRLKRRRIQRQLDTLAREREAEGAAKPGKVTPFRKQGSGRSTLN
jgi:hypothetical protein